MSDSDSISDFTKITDETDVKTWIKTDVVSGSYDRNGFRVTWIDWDSDFRNSDLQIEDIIIGYGDVSLEPFLESGKHGGAIGQHGETPYWQKLGVKHGHIIVLKVFREGIKDALEVSGKLQAQRFYTNKEEKRALGPGGPPSMMRDGFSDSWSSWHEKLVSKMSYVLDGGWDHKTINNKKELKEIDGHKKRLDFLSEKYCNAFTRVVLSDWKKVHDSLSGKQVDDVDLEYREIGAKRVETVKEDAKIAWNKLHSDLEKQMIQAFPVIDVDQRDQVKDKIVELPWIGPRNIINDLGQSYAVIGNRVEGFYFVQLSNSVPVRKLYDAMYGYQSQVNPKLAERYQYVARITGEPALITYDGKAVTGLMAEIVAARAGDGEFFVNLQDVENNEKVQFAGQEKISQFVPMTIEDEAMPAQVMEAMIAAVKLGHEKSWRGLFVTWKASKYWGNRISFDPTYIHASLFTGAWKNSRKLIAGRLYDVRVDKVGRIRRILNKDEKVGLPDIDEVDVFVDHYELTEDGRYNSFVDVTVKRKWTLQRLDQGPWRIATIQVI